MDRAVILVNNSKAITPAKELPAESNPGDQTHTASSPGTKAKMPPPTPLFAGKPTRKAKSPATSFP